MTQFSFNRRPLSLKPSLHSTNDLAALVSCVPPTELLNAFNALIKNPAFPSVKLFSGESMDDLLLNFREFVVGEFFFGKTNKDKWTFYKMDEFELDDGRKINLIVLASRKVTHVLTNTALTIFRA